MIQIDNHNELAVSTLIPYLLEFPQIAKLAEQSGNRYQDIENIAWQLLYNLDYTTANGIWLDYIGRKVGQNRIYTPVPTDAFTFGGSSDEGFGAGRFKGTASIRSTKLARSDSEFRSAIKAKIIQNNTDTSLDELIQACPLTDCTHRSSIHHPPRPCNSSCAYTIPLPTHNRHSNSATPRCSNTRSDPPNPYARRQEKQPAHRYTPSAKGNRKIHSLIVTCSMHHSGGYTPLRTAPIVSPPCSAPLASSRFPSPASAHSPRLVLSPRFAHTKPPLPSGATAAICGAKN